MATSKYLPLTSHTPCTLSPNLPLRPQKYFFGTTLESASSWQVGREIQINKTYVAPQQSSKSAALISLNLHAIYLCLLWHSRKFMSKLEILWMASTTIHVLLRTSVGIIPCIRAMSKGQPPAKYCSVILILKDEDINPFGIDGFFSASYDICVIS